jgi:threonine-phosphate decarboxylase
MLKGHGSDIHSYNSPIIADFSSNVWYEGMPKGLSNHLSEKIQNIIHYPSPDADKLSKKIAHLHGIDNNNVLVTNGATEAFYLLAQLYFGVKSYIVYPSFAEYEDACKIFNHSLNFIPNTEFESTIKFNKDSIVWLGNPNNPDGKILSVSSIEDFCKNNPEIHFIIDEAYVELSDKCETSIQLVLEYENLIIVRSLTKSFTIPGIRLGYVAASSKIIEKLKTIKMPWSVNSLAIEAGDFILNDYYNLLPKKNIVTTESKKLQNELSKFSELEIIPSDCNYFLASLKNGIASELKQYLIEEYNFLIRDASNFRGLNNSHFRIAAQKPEFNTMLVDAIKQWLNKRV